MKPDRARPPAAVSRRLCLRTALLWCIIIPALEPFSAPALPRKPSPEEEGRALALDLRRQPPALNTTGTLRRRDSQGKWLPPLPVQLDVRNNGGSWESFYRVFAPSGALMETLVVSQSDGGPNEYTFRRPGEGGEAVTLQDLKGNEASRPLADSDFWLCDLGLEFLHWPDQRIAKTEMRKSRSCRVLESLNPEPRSGAYAKVLSWIDIETSGLMRAEAFGTDGKRMKEFNIGSLKKVNDRYQLKSMEIRNVATDTRTRLEFDLEID